MVGDKYPNISILDLASGGNCVIKPLILEGIDYTAIEIREENVDLISKQLSNLPNAKVLLVDVRKLDELNLDKFDIVIIAGLLYHLSPGDNLKVLTKTLELAKSGIIIDTLFQNEGVNKYFELNGYIYSGRPYYEHKIMDKSKLIKSRIRASFQNEGERYLSFTMTEDSFIRLLRHLGCKMISRYKYSPVINEAPSRPPKTGNENKPWTSLMHNERGILAIYCDLKLVKKDYNCGYFKFLKDKNKCGYLSNNQVDEIQRLLYNLILENVNNESTLFEIIHNAGRMLPLSLHNIIINAGILAKMELSYIVALRIYAESYLKTVNIVNDKKAAKFINSYLEYLCSFDIKWAISMAATIRNYLINTLPYLSRNVVFKWLYKEGKIKSIFRRLKDVFI